MAWSKRSILVSSLVMAACLAMAGAAGAAEMSGAVCKAAANVGTPEPLDLQRLNPDCCRSISTVSEATCDSVSWSADRCNQYGGGGLCAWTCSCCQPIGSTYGFAYCSQFDQYGADRCNQVWQGTACAWTC